MYGTFRNKPAAKTNADVCEEDDFSSKIGLLSKASLPWHSSHLAFL